MMSGTIAANSALPLTGPRPVRGGPRPGVITRLVRGARRAHCAAFRRRALRASTPFELTAAATVVVAPHPDDETLGCGGLIARKVAMGAPLRVVILSDGRAHRDAGALRDTAQLAERRRAEAIAALGVLGVVHGQIEFLDLPDGRLAELAGDRLRAGRDSIRAALRPFADGRPAGEVFVTHRGDGHPDHEAAYRLVARTVADAAPTARLIEYAIWLGWRSAVLLRPGAGDLRGARRLDVSTVRDLKGRAIDQHVSQVGAFPPGFLDQFRDSTEIFFTHP